ncbi:MAG: inorganic phosphate transporter [Marinilabiliaceae bacterium]|nr:inorganic phosphate transporter [Marinilabiliaceae bacterium]
MTFIWIAVILLGVFAIVDLVIGVTNDAVNFLQAAIGSRVARRRAIYWVAAGGLLIGCLLSAGMMEVARKGVIYPSSFDFTEIMVVFLAVMLTDMILVDSFNTLGFPTSTTIAVVFELFGGAMALSLIKKGEAKLEGIEVEQLINTDRAFVILAGILLSIFLAFIVGIIVQFFTRIIFTFHYKRRFKFLFSFVGGLAITAIVFLIAKKVLGGASFVDDTWLFYLNNYLPEILMGVFALTSFIFLFLGLSFDLDIPRMVVIFGTFALAMSFAANDLVNFIGLPLAALESFKVFLGSGLDDPGNLPMDFLNDNLLRKDTLSDSTYLIISGVAAAIMTVTLFYSKKAKGVTETEVYLGRQSSGYERFEPSYMSRVIVRNFLSFHTSLLSVLPKPIVSFFDSRYRRTETPEGAKTVDGVIFFDTVRASVNLVVASVLISVGTYMRFPLSTTLVVFMVAMGSSLADQAWGRESAVYRVSGVLSILGGWFFTACIAFIGAFIFTYVIWYGGWVATLILTVLVGFALYKSTKYYRRKQEERKVLREEFQDDFVNNLDYLRDEGGEQIRRNVQESAKIYFLAVQGFIDNDIRRLHEATNKADILEKYARNGKSQLFFSFTKVSEDGIDSGHHFVQAFDYLTELIGCLKNLSQPLYEHLENHHKGVTASQRDDLQVLLDEVTAYFNHFIHIEKEQKFELLQEMVTKQNFLLGFLDDLRKNQIKRIKSGEGRTRVSILYMDVISETKNMLLYSVNLLKAHRDFVASTHRATPPDPDLP